MWILETIFVAIKSRLFLNRSVFGRFSSTLEGVRPSESQMRTPEPFKPMVLSILLERQKELESLKEEDRVL
ncbi:hypothetical protein AKJ39_03985 [candidate division MSBL1 archaeon SCGC-AAA259J03]|uniref:Uncharacterized protein n=1 Tax=candidate division MSBL1 archaeon SCGC-AAA259J03 TaxID=1698269 RepID=A0A656YY15_9EURY|nr:hypothetical protein AKJ39_03985 [candidate division MSBL1 archaeon SCGC-AAA259J03]